MEKGERKTASGFVLMDDNGKEEGIRARWGQILSIGPDVSNELSVGDWILVEHGRWTRPMEVVEDGETMTLYGIEEESILAVSDEQPVEFAQRY